MSEATEPGQADEGSGSGPAPPAVTLPSSCEALARLEEIARRVFSCPTAIVSTVPLDAQLSAAFAALEGIDAEFARHVMESGKALLVPDARRDRRFSPGLLVNAFPFIRFYAGCPILLSHGRPVGVVSVVDYAPRHDFGPLEVETLKMLAACAAEQVERTMLELTRLDERIQLELLAEASGRAVLEMDEGGTVVCFNRAALTLLQIEARALGATSVSRYVVGWDRIARDCQMRLCEQARSRSTGHALAEVMTAAGSAVPVRIAYSCWLDHGRLNYRLVLEPLEEG